MAPPGTPRPCSPPPTPCAGSTRRSRSPASAPARASRHGWSPRPGCRWSSCRGCRCRAVPAPTCCACPAGSAPPAAPPSTSSTGCAPTSSSASVATSRCRPTSPPARAGCPLVVHEGNAIAGRRQQARRAVHHARRDQLPRHRAAARDLHRAADPADDLDPRPRRPARRGAGPLRPRADRPTLLVTGGSQGAARINAAVSGAAPALAAAGVQVLHVVGPKNEPSSRPRAVAPYVVEQYVDRMDLAYAAADAVLCRAGSNTVTEVSGVGTAGRLRAAADRQRRAGAQRPRGRRRRRRPARRRRGPHPGVGRATACPHCSPTAHRLDAMGAAAADVIPLDADEKLARIILGARRSMRVPGPRRAAARRAARPGALRRHRRRRPVGDRADHGPARHRRSPAATTRTPPSSRRCASSGSTCHLGYAAEHVGDADTVVVTTAAREDNPEVLEAQRRGLRCCPARPASPR